MAFQTDYPPIELPSTAGYLPIFDLFDLAANPLNGVPCRNALVSLQAHMVDLGIDTLENLPTVVSFLDLARFSAFKVLMESTNCEINTLLIPSGFGKRAQLTHEISIEGYAEDTKGHSVRVVFQLIPIPQSTSVIVDHMLPFASASRQTLDALVRSAGEACALGVDRAVLSGIRVLVTLVDLKDRNRALRERKETGLGRGFFKVFDSIFDTVDSVFARGTGHDFADMGDAPLQPVFERLIRLAVRQAFAEGVPAYVQISELEA